MLPFAFIFHEPNRQIIATYLPIQINNYFLLINIQQYYDIPFAKMTYYNIRKADISDWIDIDKCNRITAAENYDGTFYKSFLESTDASNFILELNYDETVGYILATKQQNPSSKAIGHIMSICILKDHRKKGYGKKLIKKVEHDLIFRFGIKYMSLHVKVTNTIAYNLYTKLGYKKVETIKKYYKNTDGYLMKKYIK